jgi:hypothetical protein
MLRTTAGKVQLLSDQVLMETLCPADADCNSPAWPVNSRLPTPDFEAFITSSCLRRRRHSQCRIGHKGERAGDRREIATVAIITADRPHLLARCLKSLVRNCEVGHNRPRILIVDGSRQKRHRAANCRTAHQIATRTQHVVEYIGAEEVRALRDGLTAAGVPRSVVEFSLTPGAAGANRNIALLQARGDDLLMIDDDVICTPWSLKEREAGVAIAGTADLREVRFFSSRREALKAGRTPIGLLNAHGQLLRATLTDLRSGVHGGVVDMRDSTGDRLPAVNDSRAYRVRVTMSGLARDSGTWCPYLMLLVSGDLKERLGAPG